MIRSEELADELILYYLHVCTKPYLNDNSWRIFGFNGRPKHGSLIQKIAPKKFVYENIVFKTLLFLPMIDIVISIRKSSHDNSVKHMIIIGVLDKLLSTATDMFDEDFIDEFIRFCGIYLKNEKANICASLTKEYRDNLSDKELANYMIGTLKVMSCSNSSGIMLDTSIMLDRIEDTDLDGAKIGLYMGVDYFERYNQRLLKLVA